MKYIFIVDIDNHYRLFIRFHSAGHKDDSIFTRELKYWLWGTFNCKKSKV